MIAHDIPGAYRIGSYWPGTIDLFDDIDCFHCRPAWSIDFVLMMCFNEVIGVRRAWKTFWRCRNQLKEHVNADRKIWRYNRGYMAFDRFLRFCTLFGSESCRSNDESNTSTCGFFDNFDR